MKFVAPDTCLADYHRRAIQVMRSLRAAGATPKAQLLFYRKWREKNSPFDAREYADNLRRAIYGKGR